MAMAPPSGYIVYAGCSYCLVPLLKLDGVCFYLFFWYYGKFQVELFLSTTSVGQGIDLPAVFARKRPRPIVNDCYHDEMIAFAIGTNEHHFQFDASVFEFFDNVGLSDDDGFAEFSQTEFVKPF